MAGGALIAIVRERQRELGSSSTVRFVIASIEIGLSADQSSDVHIAIAPVMLNVKVSSSMVLNAIVSIEIG
jgi:hypothetical protein